MCETYHVGVANGLDQLTPGIVRPGGQTSQ